MFWKIKNILDGKNVLILGFGREGRSTLNFIKKHIDYKSVTVADKNIVDISDYTDVDGLFGEHYMTTSYVSSVVI